MQLPYVHHIPLYTFGTHTSKKMLEFCPSLFTLEAQDECVAALHLLLVPLCTLNAPRSSPSTSVPFICKGSKYIS